MAEISLADPAVEQDDIQTRRTALDQRCRMLDKLAELRRRYPVNPASGGLANHPKITCPMLWW